jgi:hypothetical protein
MPIVIPPSMVICGKPPRREHDLQHMECLLRSRDTCESLLDAGWEVISSVGGKRGNSEPRRRTRGPVPTSARFALTMGTTMAW